jgi:ubiquinone/menaquinone biosynthesis C-methylase UbiE
MNWKNFWNKKADADNKLAQVGRTNSLDALTDEAIRTYLKNVLELAEINAETTVLDVCCGNGLVTAKIRPYCKSITGIDFAQNLLTIARLDYPDISFYEADVSIPNATLLPTLTTFDRITLCFSFQYFEKVETGKQVIENLLRYLNADGKIILTDIPDRAKFFHFYHTPKMLLGLALQMVKNNNDMGKFWSEDELNLICKQLGVKGKKMLQPINLPYAHYRFDYIITR